jgi:hypothetical protein
VQTFPFDETGNVCFPLFGKIKSFTIKKTRLGKRTALNI